MNDHNGIHPAVRVGHVHLHVSDIDRALGFYRDGLGFHVTGDGRAMGLPMAFVAAYHHHTDHGGTVAVYLDDPDGNGIKLSYDRPRETWFDADGNPILRNDRISVDAI